MSSHRPDMWHVFFKELTTPWEGAFWKADKRKIIPNWQQMQNREGGRLGSTQLSLAVEGLCVGQHSSWRKTWGSKATLSCRFLNCSSGLQRKLIAGYGWGGPSSGLLSISLSGGSTWDARCSRWALWRCKGVNHRNTWRAVPTWWPQQNQQPHSHSTPPPEYPSLHRLLTWDWLSSPMSELQIQLKVWNFVKLAKK